jgi:hypothetical protein
MKNLLVYLNPEKKFDLENKVYMEIQIENSLNLGWSREDIMMVTNFPCRCKGVEALVVPDSLYSDISRCVNKVNVIIYLLENGLLNDFTWYHDTEAWQINKFDLNLEKDLGLTDYGWSLKWNGGSIFFKPEALDVFKLWQKTIEETRLDDERSMMILTKGNVENINSRIQRLNITYNIGKRNIRTNLRISERPLKVFHFHPYREHLLKKFNPILPKRLSKMMYAKKDFDSWS